MMPEFWKGLIIGVVGVIAFDALLIVLLYFYLAMKTYQGM